MLFEDAERGLNDNLRLQFEVLATMSLEEQTFANAALDATIVTSQVVGVTQRVNASAVSATKAKKPVRERVRA